MFAAETNANRQRQRVNSNRNVNANRNTNVNVNNNANVNGGGHNNGCCADVAKTAEVHHPWLLQVARQRVAVVNAATARSPPY